MQESELRALISLLEDEDPAIKTHVEQKLFSLGEMVIPTLEKAWEQEGNEQLQNRIADVIHVIQRQHTITDLKEWKVSKSNDLLKGWYLVTQYQFPELDFGIYKRMVNRLVNKIWLELRGGMSVRDKFRIINRMLFERERFKGVNSHQLFDPQNYYVNGVMETRKGSPLSLGMLYMIICNELDIPVHGILLPGYFVLHYEDEQLEIFIDVYDRGRFFSRRDLKGFLKQKKIEDTQRYYQASSKIFIILTLIQVIIYCYEQRKKSDKVREFELLIKGIELRE